MTELKIEGTNNEGSARNMNWLLQRTLLFLFVAGILMTGLVGCNTAHGFGKDVEKAGEKIQDGTK